MGLISTYTQRSVCILSLVVAKLLLRLNITTDCILLGIEK